MVTYVRIVMELPQLVHNMKMSQKLPLKGRRIAKSSQSQMTAEFVYQLSGAKEKTTELEIKGRIRHTQLKSAVVNTLHSASLLDSTITSPSFPTCDCIRYKSSMYAIAKPKNSRDGSICIFDDENILHFGSIIQFCFINRDLIAIIRAFDEMNQTIFDNIRASTRQAELNRASCNFVANFMFCVKKSVLTDKLYAIPASQIVAKCVHVPFEGTPYDYIVTIPNMFEHH